MNHIFEVVLLVVAAGCFLAASANMPSRINLVALGLFSWVLTVLIPQFK